MPDPNDSPHDRPLAGRPSRRLVLGGGLAAAGSVAAAGAFRSNSATTGRRFAPAPAARRTADDAAAPAYVGYRRADYARPWGRFFTERTSPVQAQVRTALARGPVPTADVPSLAELRQEMRRSGYSPIETGFGTTKDGALWTAVRTDMPGVRPEMWDWWFGWHSSESSRYKLWHPEAHLRAALLDDRADDPNLTDRQRYLGNTSYVDEYLPDYRSGYDYLGSQAGGVLVQLGITFVEPRSEGFDLSAFDGTLIAGRSGPQGSAQTTGVLCHQVRATSTGSEMRSRFYLPAEVSTRVRPADPAAAAALVARGPLPVLATPKQQSFLMLHCGQEMNHLAGFLPRLYAEFGRR